MSTLNTDFLGRPLVDLEGAFEPLSLLDMAESQQGAQLERHRYAALGTASRGITAISEVHVAVNVLTLSEAVVSGIRPSTVRRCFIMTSPTFCHQLK